VVCFRPGSFKGLRPLAFRLHLVYTFLCSLEPLPHEGSTSGPKASTLRGSRPVPLEERCKEEVQRRCPGAVQK